MSEIKARIHSIETCGTVDGPGIRTVIFFQGCPLRCQYCHNPDSWNPQDGTLNDIDDLFTEIQKYQNFMRFSNGGVTLTGGEPLLQTQAAAQLLKKCKQAGIHTALDTSGFIFNDQVKQLLQDVDLVLLDIKNFDPNQYQHITGVKLDRTLQFLEYLTENNIETWIRYVLVPNLTDNYPAIEALSQHLSPRQNISRIEVLPFHKIGEYKWSEMGLAYQLTDTPAPDPAAIAHTKQLFQQHNPIKLIA